MKIICTLHSVHTFTLDQWTLKIDKVHWYSTIDIQSRQWIFSQILIRITTILLFRHWRSQHQHKNEKLKKIYFNNVWPPAKIIFYFVLYVKQFSLLWTFTIWILRVPFRANDFPHTSHANCFCTPHSNFKCDLKALELLYLRPQCLGQKYIRLSLLINAVMGLRPGKRKIRNNHDWCKILKYSQLHDKILKKQK